MIRKIGAAIAAIVLATSSGVAADQTSPTYQNAMHGTWIADLKSTGPQGGALQSVLVFQGDEYKLELRSGLTGLTRLTVVGHFTAETEAGDATRVRVTFNPVRWQPTQSCQAGACRDIGPIPPNATEFTVDDHDTIQDDAGEIYHRRVKHGFRFRIWCPQTRRPRRCPRMSRPRLRRSAACPISGCRGCQGYVQAPRCRAMSSRRNAASPSSPRPPTSPYARSIRRRTAATRSAGMAEAPRPIANTAFAWAIPVANAASTGGIIPGFVFTKPFKSSATKSDSQPPASPSTRRCR
jgi:hypothetical protein